MTIRDTRTHSPAAPEQLFIREGWKDINGDAKMIFLAHRDVRCDYCEFPLRSKIKHELVDAEAGIHLVCGGYHVRLIS